MGGNTCRGNKQSGQSYNSEPAGTPAGETNRVGKVIAQSLREHLQGNKQSGQSYSSEPAGTPAGETNRVGKVIAQSLREHLQGKQTEPVEHLQGKQTEWAKL